MALEHEVHDYTCSAWSQWNSKKSLKKNLEAIPGKDSLIHHKTRLCLELHT
jgi:hypothetical protein